MSLLPSPPLRLIIVASDSLIRMGMAALLGTTSDLEIAGSLDPGAAARGDLRLYTADLALWIVDDQTDVGSLNDARDLGSLILALTRQELAAGCWTAGARGVLKRDASARQIEAGGRAIMAGLSTIEPTWIDLLAARRGMAAEDKGDIEGLTAREQEVLALLAEGLPNKTIALRLQISENTVKFHLNALMMKLGAQSRTEAVVRAARSGLLML